MIKKDYYQMKKKEYIVPQMAVMEMADDIMVLSASDIPVGENPDPGYEEDPNAVNKDMNWELW